MDLKQTWKTIDGLKSTNEWGQNLNKSYSQYHHHLTDQSLLADQPYNTINW